MKTQIPVWLTFCKAHYAPNSVEHYRSTLHHFAKQIPEGKIEPSQVEDYITQLALQSSKSTANTRLTALKSFFRWYANRNGGYNPASKVSYFPQKDIVVKQRCLSQREFEMVLKVTSGADRDIIEFVGHTGVRSHELLSLTPDSVRGDLLRLRGKGNKERAIPLNKIALAILDRNWSENTFKFTGFYHYRHELYNMCLRAATVACIPRFGLHAIRHYFCTRMVQAGTPIKVVSLIMGHSSVSITEKIYTHLTEQDIKGACDVLV